MAYLETPEVLVALLYVSGVLYQVNLEACFADHQSLYEEKKIISKAKEGKTTSIISLDEQLRCQISLGDLLFDVGVVGR